MLENLAIRFLTEPTTELIIALIIADWVTGVAAALRAGTFDLAKIGRFMLSNVLPYVLCYMLVYAFDTLALGPLLNGSVSDLMNFGWTGVIVATLAGSIYNNLKVLRPEPTPPTPGGPSHDL